MENGECYYQAWKKSRLSGQEGEDLEKEVKIPKSGPPPVIVQPRTPKEPMEFLSRSWSVSAEEISKALANKHKHYLLADNHPPSPAFSEPASTSPPYVVDKMASNGHSRRIGGIGKWFHHHKESIQSSSVKRKDRVRADNAHMHAALSIAGLATAVAAIAAADNSSSASKMGRAVASATELLASHCIEIAEQTGADLDRIASAVRSAVDIRIPGDLMTMTAAAATALRAESALRARLPKDAKKNASISPYDKGLGDAFQIQTEESEFPCIGELLQHTRKGELRSKQVSIYINKKSQAMIKLKSKHVGGAFSKKDKCLVYGVCDEINAWGLRKDERENVDAYFGLKTAQGFLEFRCTSKVHKQQWVDGIQSMLQKLKVGSVQDVDHSLQRLHIN